MNIYMILYSMDPEGCEVLFSLWLGLLFLLSTPLFHRALDWSIEERRARRDG